MPILEDPELSRTVAWSSVPAEVQAEIREAIGQFCFDNFSALISEKGRGFLSRVSDVVDNIQEVCVENGVITIRLFPTKVLKYESRTLARFNIQSIIVRNGDCTFSAEAVLDSETHLFALQPGRHQFFDTAHMNDYGIFDEVF